MRIVVSGTHASGKSTLVGDFAAANPGYLVLPDPFELIDGALDEPDAGAFFAQLRVAAARLHDLPPDAIAERGPLDFLAYLSALDALGRPGRAPELFERGLPIAEDAMRHVDLFVLLPLNSADGIRVPEDEDPELREAMNDALLELSDEFEVPTLELTGDRERRLRVLSDYVMP